MTSETVRSPARSASPGPHEFERSSSPASTVTSADTAPAGHARSAYTQVSGRAMISPALPSLTNDARGWLVLACTFHADASAPRNFSCSSAGPARACGGPAGGTNRSTTWRPGGGQGRSRASHSGRFFHAIRAAITPCVHPAKV
jgi:hypothetical protein